MLGAPRSETETGVAAIGAGGALVSERLGSPPSLKWSAGYSGAVTPSAATRLTFREARRDDVPDVLRLLVDDELARSREALDSGELPGAHRDAFVEIDRDPATCWPSRSSAARSSGCSGERPSMTHVGSERMPVESIRIDSRHRGRGHGRAMMAWAIERARDRGCRAVELTTNKPCLPARRFYRSLGFLGTHEG